MPQKAATKAVYFYINNRCPSILQNLYGQIYHQLSLEALTKLARLDRDELAALHVVYHTLYPTLAETSPAMATLYKKYSSLTVAGERYGSTLA